MNLKKQLFTIGHSNHSIERFIELLKLHKITAVADVRSHPYSQYLPHFNKAQLQEALKKAGLYYVFLGQELGARPNDSRCYSEGKAVYEKIAATDLFSQGLNRLRQGLEKQKIALICAEKDPITCHRTILICQNLRDADILINHILSNGELESHQDLEERLLNLHELNQPLVKQLSLFEVISSSAETSREENLKKAYQLQGQKIAYTLKKDSESIL